MDATGTQNPVLPLEEARRLVEEHASGIHSPETESVGLLDSVERVLAEEVRADRDLPPFSRATRDGYAVRSVDVDSVPVTLRIVAEIRAGEPRAFKVAAGQAAEIMTGAPVPDGADAVVMIEYTARHGDDVMVERMAGAGENLVPQASEARAGDVLLMPGYRMNHAAVSVAAAVGKSQLTVYARPKIAILATGDELVAVTDEPRPSQIRNSNTFSLAAQVRSAGGDPVLLPVAPDDPDRLRELLREGFGADLLLVTGGVSMGKYDLVEQILGELGAEFFFTGVLIQPGKPAVFGRALGKYFFGLPGNPVSTMVTFELFARPLINALSGAPAGKLRFVQARLKADIHVKTGLTRFLPALLSGEYHSAGVELVRSQGSGDVAAMARANCYVVVPRNRDHIFANEMIDVLL